MIPILVLRHAPTLWNLERRLQGHADIPLSQEGRALASRWRLPPETSAWPCLASPLRRTLETAEAMGLVPRGAPALIEMDWGALEGRTLAEIRAERGAAFAAEEALGLDFRPDGGETPREVGARAMGFLAGLTRPAVIVTHKGVLRALFALATGWDMRAKPPARIEDACCHRFAVNETGCLRLLAANIPLLTQEAAAGRDLPDMPDADPKAVP